MLRYTNAFPDLIPFAIYFLNGIFLSSGLKKYVDVQNGQCLFYKPLAIYRYKQYIHNNHTHWSEIRFADQWCVHLLSCVFMFSLISRPSRWRYLRRCIACWPEIVKCFLVCFLDIYDFVSSHTSLFIPATEFSAPRVFFRILSWFTFHNSLIPCSIHWFFFLHFTRPPDKKKITMNQCNRNRYFCVFVHFIYVFYVHTIDLPQKKWFRCEHENRLINSV